MASFGPPLMPTYCLNLNKGVVDKYPVLYTTGASCLTMRVATLMEDITTKKTTNIREECNNTAIVSSVLVVALLLLVIALVIGHRI
jgi:hypothetical protein